MLNQYVFLASSSYSGSTLLAFVLGSHSRIATVGEARGLNFDITQNQYRCSCGQLYLSCHFWKRVEQEMRKRVSPLFSLEDLNSKIIPMSQAMTDKLHVSVFRVKWLETIRDWLYRCSGPHRNYIDERVAHCIGLAESVADIYGKDIFFDTSKTPAAVVHLKKNLKCGFKVLFLLRDGRGVLGSYLKKKIPLSESEIVKLWMKVNKKIEHVLKYVSHENVCVVLYEDLCAYPEKTLERICDFIGVDYEENCMRYWEHEHHIIGNNMRLDVKRAIRHDEGWRRILTPRQQELFDKLAGPYNRKWGYE